MPTMVLEESIFDHFSDLIFAHADARDKKGHKSALKKLGKYGEDFACKFLQNQGWRIIEKNWRAGRFAEIDIVARDPFGIIVFLEVKTRRKSLENSGFSLVGFEAVNKRKQQKIVTSAKIYLAQREQEEPSCRFDVLVIEFPRMGERSIKAMFTGPVVTHVKGAFTI
jgi:putative endonuclease